MKRRICVLLLTFVMLISSAACGASPENKESTSVDLLFDKKLISAMDEKGLSFDSSTFISDGKRAAFTVNKFIEDSLESWLYLFSDEGDILLEMNVDDQLEQAVSGVLGLSFLPDEKLAIAVSLFDENENNTNIDFFSVYCISMDEGKVESRKDFSVDTSFLTNAKSKEEKAERLSFSEAAITSDGTIFLWTIERVFEGPELSRFIIWDKNGNLLWEEDPALQKAGGWFTGGFVSNGENVYVFGTDEKLNQQVFLFDMKKKALVTEDKLFSSFSESDWICSGVGDFFVQDKLGYYRMDVETNSKETLLLWESMEDRRPDTRNSVIYFQNGKFLLLDPIGNWSNLTINYEFFLLTPATGDENSEKLILTIGGLGISSDSTIGYAVRIFEKMYPEVQVKIKDYTNGENIYESEVYERAFGEMLLDMYAENPPDILVENRIVSLSVLKNKGLFLDLLPFMEEDTEFHSDDYFQSLFIKEDEPVYQVYTDFAVIGMVSAKPVTDGRMQLTMKEFDDLVASFSEDQKPFHAISSGTLLSSLSWAMLPDLIDESKGTVNLQSDTFRNILEFSKKHGLSQDEMSAVLDIDAENLYRENRVLFSLKYLERISHFSHWRQEFGAPVTMTGIPTENGIFPFCVTKQAYGIHASTEQKDIAWNFIKVLLGKEVGDSIVEHSLPFRKSSLEAKIQEEKERDSSSMSEEEEKLLYQLIENMSMATAFDYRFDFILQEEAEAYFCDQKTIEDVMKICQTRIETYVNDKWG